MGIFDDKHFRLGRVTNMDARSNKALIELIESSIDQLTTLVNSGRFSGDELDAMICELNTLHSQLNYQRGMKCVMDVEHAEKEKENHIPKDIGVFVNNHNDYDEVTVMKKYLLDKGIPIDDIYIDSLGLSTYDSIYRAKEVYNINSAIVVTQKYHLYRSLYISNSMNLDYYGVSSDKRIYQGQEKREIREILARNKDFVNCLLKSKSKHTELKEEV